MPSKSATGVELDLGDEAAQDSSLCWSLDWLGEENDGCDTSAVWLVNGSGYVAWNATNEWGCSSLNTTIYIEDLGRPNAIVGGDTVLCNQAIPNIMAFEFGAPYALGCNPTQGVWEGQGANLEFFTEVWTGGNCVDAGDPWIDSLWTFTPDSVGVYEWVWTVTDCNGCVDRDTLNITVVEPTCSPNSRSAWMHQSDRSPRKARRVGSGAASRQTTSLTPWWPARAPTSGWSGLERAHAP